MQTYHQNGFAHASDDTNSLFIDYCFMRCSRLRLSDPSQFIKSAWIRPEDLAVYEAMEYTSFKLLERGIPSAELLRRVKAYSERRFDGNLAELLLSYGFKQPIRKEPLWNLRHFLKPRQVSPRRLKPMLDLAHALAKSGPIVVVVVGTAIVAAFQLGERSADRIIGEIPGGLPSFVLPELAASEFLPLIPLALAISFIGFLETISIGRALAAKRRQKVDSDQEFIALGSANLAAGISGGHPVSGSFARSTVNFNAGANTGLASLVTVVVVGLAAFFLMPLFHHLPQAVLAAIITVAVTRLMDFRMPRRLWRYNKADAAALAVTFIGVLTIGITKGILIGAASTIMLHLWRTSRPHMAIVGRVPNTGHFRNVERHKVETLPHVLLLRIDESLYFANTKYIENFVHSAAADHPQLRHLVLICNAINFIDASALETLTDLKNKGKWNIAKGKLKQKWASLTDDDLEYTEGKQDELVGRIQKRTGESRETVEKAVKDASSDS